MVFSTTGPPTNDGGVVLALLVAALTIAISLIAAVSFYVAASPTTKSAPRLVSGFANVGNGVIHLILTVYMLSNSHNQSPYWLKEREVRRAAGT